jgi:hypothetical protein
MKYFLIAGLLIAPAAAILLSDNAQAHPGRTNASGCHNDRINGGYHCHNSGGSGGSSAPTGGSSTPTYTPQSDADRIRARGTMEAEDWIQGAGFSGSCTIEADANLRSGPSTESNIIGNSGAGGQRATIHTTEFHESRLWAWATVDGTDAWVAADLFAGCR